MELNKSISLPPCSKETITNLEQALKGYGNQIEQSDILRICRSFDSVSDADTQWISKVRLKLGIKGLAESMKLATAENQRFLDLLSERLHTLYSNGHVMAAELAPSPSNEPFVGQVRGVLLHIARDWSSDSAERNEAYAPILKSLCAYGTAGPVLVSANGLGRLAYDIVHATNRDCTVIEEDPLRCAAMMSVFESSSQFTVFPHVLETCNRLRAEDNVGGLLVPDICIEKAVVLGQISVTGHSIWHIGSVGLFSHVITCFTLDSMGGPLAELVAHITSLLLPGGVWINCGPLRLGDSRTILFSEEELMAALVAVGFQIREHRSVVSTFLANPRSIMRTEHVCVLFVAQR